MRANTGPELVYSQQREQRVRILAALAQARYRRQVRRNLFWSAVGLLGYVLVIVWLHSDQAQRVYQWIDGGM